MKPTTIAILAASAAIVVCVVLGAAMATAQALVLLEPVPLATHALIGLSLGLGVGGGLWLLARAKARPGVNPNGVLGVGIGFTLVAPFAVHALVILGNSMLDDGPVHAFDRIVLARPQEKQRTRSGEREIYYLEVDAFLDHHAPGPVRVRVARQDYKRMRPGTTVRLSVRDGRFGYAWLADVRVLP